MRQRGTTPSGGDNPYADEFGVLSYPEMQRILAKYPPARRGNPGIAGAEKVYVSNIAQEAGLGSGKTGTGSLAQFRAFCRGNPNALGRKRRRALSRILMMLESGQLVKRGGKMTYLPHDHPSVAAPVATYRVCLGPDGRATITRGEPPPAPKQMPKMFSEWSLPNVWQGEK